MSDSLAPIRHRLANAVTAQMSPNESYQDFTKALMQVAAGAIYNMSNFTEEMRFEFGIRVYVEAMENYKRPSSVTVQAKAEA